MDIRLILVVLLVALSAAIVAYLVFQKYGGSLVEKLDTYRSGVGLRLRRTRNPFSNERFQRFQQILTGVTALLGLLIGAGVLGRLFMAAVFGAVSWFGADQYLNVLYRKYCKDFEEQLPDMVGVVANAVKAGNSVQQALELVVEEFTDPMSAEVSEVLHELRVGTALDVAIRNWLDRMPNDDLEIFGMAVIIQRQTGGNLAEILDNLATTMRDRKKMQGQIRTLTTQGRMSGAILSMLPVGLYCMLYLIMPERMGILFTHPFGWGIIGVCGLMIGLGGFVISRIVAIDV
ncbi:type II secretion system F family protein [bacterium]|nr:type II secretion system F family protein [bacterium]